MPATSGSGGACAARRGGKIWIWRLFGRIERPSSCVFLFLFLSRHNIGLRLATTTSRTRAAAWVGVAFSPPTDCWTGTKLDGWGKTVYKFCRGYGFRHVSSLGWSGHWFCFFFLPFPFTFPSVLVCFVIRHHGGKGSGSSTNIGRRSTDGRIVVLIPFSIGIYQPWQTCGGGGRWPCSVLLPIWDGSLGIWDLGFGLGWAFGRCGWVICLGSCGRGLFRWWCLIERQ